MIFLGVVLILQFCHLPHEFSLYTFPHSFIFFFLGFEFNEYITKGVSTLQNRTIFGVSLSILALLCVGIIYNKIGNLDIGRGYYTDYKILSLTTALIGSLGIIMLCSIIKWRSRVIELISSATLLIMCLYIPTAHFIQLHIFSGPLTIVESVISSLLIVAFLAAIYIPVQRKLPILVGMRSVFPFTNINHFT